MAVREPAKVCSIEAAGSALAPVMGTPDSAASAARKKPVARM
jgi:hypothetical protein